MMRNQEQRTVLRLSVTIAEAQPRLEQLSSERDSDAV